MAKYTFLDMAHDVLCSQQSPLTVDQIWAVAEQTGLTEKLAFNGVTPKQTLGARIYVDVKHPDSKLVKIGAWPARFMLKANADNLTGSELENYQAGEPEETPTPPKFLEKDLHPYLVSFAASEFSGFEATCKTICHNKSEKKGAKVNEWLHPDIVGFSLETDGWATETVGLFRETDSLPVSLYSFELKQSLSFGTLRENFFQAVSNSSWAHQGYLVAANINEDPEFRDELERLSTSFGIGVIKLDVAQPSQSFVLFSARKKSQLDWKTINRLVSSNSDFKQFIQAVSSSVKINQVVAHGFDVVRSIEELTASQ